MGGWDEEEWVGSYLVACMCIQTKAVLCDGHGRPTSGYTDCVFAFGDAVIAVVERPETHICFDSGASRSACPIGSAPDVSAKGTAPPPLCSTDGSPFDDGSPIEQRGHTKVARNVIRLVTKRIGSTMVDYLIIQPSHHHRNLKELAGFSSVQMAPRQEGGVASSADVAVAEPQILARGRSCKRGTADRTR